jgi:hypothetical protein
VQTFAPIVVLEEMFQHFFAFDKANDLAGRQARPVRPSFHNLRQGINVLANLSMLRAEHLHVGAARRSGVLQIGRQQARFLPFHVFSEQRPELVKPIGGLGQVALDERLLMSRENSIQTLVYVHQVLPDWRQLSGNLSGKTFRVGRLGN